MTSEPVAISLHLSSHFLLTWSYYMQASIVSIPLNYLTITTHFKETMANDHEQLLRKAKRFIM